MNIIKKIAKKLIHIIRPSNSLKYWEQRSVRYGNRAVLNLGIDEKDIDSFTEFQKDKIFPHLSSLLHGEEKLVMDFGCGPGRFTQNLADLTGAEVIGVDPIKQFLDKAPTSDRVSYRQVIDSHIPIESNSVDLVWICLVLGGISGKMLTTTIEEIKRVLSREGKIILIENTSDKPDLTHWKYRTVENYENLFSGFTVTKLDEYEELGSTISIIKCVIDD